MYRQDFVTKGLEAIHDPELDLNKYDECPMQTQRALISQVSSRLPFKKKKIAYL